MRPAQTWQELRQAPSPWPALLTQAVLLSIGLVAAAQPMSELLASAHQAKPQSVPVAMGIALAVPVLAMVAALLTAAMLLWFRLLGFHLGYRSLFTWLAYGLTPIYLGRLLGLLSFAVVRPLAQSPAEALQLQINPLGLNLAALFPPLSYPWVLALGLDVFALWALTLLALGATHFLGLHGARQRWFIAGLLVSWLLILTVVWQGLQASSG